MAKNQRRLSQYSVDPDIDGINRAILAELQREARLSMAELGRRVGLSAPAVAERVERLERAGVITGYHATVSPNALGRQLGVIIRMRPSPGQLRNVGPIAEKSPEVVECHRVTGDDCFYMKAYVTDVTHLEELIDRFAILGQTTSAIMQSSPVPGRGLDLDDAGGRSGI